MAHDITVEKIGYVDNESGELVTQYDLNHYRFLVRLRNSRGVNMWGAAPYLEQGFGLSRKEAKAILVAWIKSFELPASEQPDDGREEY